MTAAKNNSSDSVFIKMEVPLCEKDEQGLAMERMRKNQKDALKFWRLLKNKRK